MSPTAKWGALGAVLTVLTATGLFVWSSWTRPVRDSVRVYTQLLAAANQQDVPAARALCTARYAANHPLTPAPDGGLVGLPRNIHKNFKAWQAGEAVWLCPTNRVGPVYQFVLESGQWRFDGPVGILRGRGEFVRMPDAALADPDDAPPG